MTVLHPYYKLAYIKLAWGGAEEQAEERASGNRNVKNWQDEARKVLDTEVIVFSHPFFTSTDEFQMEKYWKSRPVAPPTATPTTPITGNDAASASASSMLEYHRYRQTLLAAEEDEGWEVELRRYLKDMPADVTADTDIIQWWQVH